MNLSNILIIICFILKNYYTCLFINLFFVDIFLKFFVIINLVFFNNIDVYIYIIKFWFIMIFFFVINVFFLVIYYY